ncbi:TPA: membrane protein insertion efficiency factor YidD [Patescibacteria group bacterium]|nr:membrane protein insertion efficiency factor YidD [Patescibacteria group bacterium]HCR42504.1 membrane protein insertion efficiency factor YidD [Patescibacteria group bacterium]
MTRLIVLLITLYQRTLSPDHGWFKFRYPYGYCRYHPTCSAYIKESIRQHGVVKGLFLGVARVSRCHPWAVPGIDPVLNPEVN